MDGISRSCGWDKEIPHCVLPMEQLVLTDKWGRIHCTETAGILQQIGKIIGQTGINVFTFQG